MESEKPDVVVAPEPLKGKGEPLESELSMNKLEIAKDGNDEAEESKDLETKLISLISQLLPLHYISDSGKMVSLVIQIITHLRSIDLDSLPKPEPKLIPLISQTISLFNTMDINSLPKSLSNLISHISQKLSIESEQESEYDFEFISLVPQTLDLKPQPQLISLIRQIVSVVISMNSNSKKLISLCPQGLVSFDEEKFHPKSEDVSWTSTYKWECFLGKWDKYSLTEEEEDATHFHCKSCNGEYHTENEKAPVEINHPLHPKHSLHLVVNWSDKTRKCYCCHKDLEEIFYFCSACDYAMNIACANKPPLLARDHPKWHEHTLALFPSQSTLRCNVCALTHSYCPFYICPPCDFVVHQNCINLPHLIRISRHPHRISFTPHFNKGDWSCGVCRRKINNDYGGYSCIKGGCSYAVHSRCATQTNVWDGIDLEGEPEEIEEEEVEPFVRISDGIIQHFSHEHHHLKLDENIDRDYDENKLCRACTTPIYFGNFYSCVQCEFVLHETCANLSRKVYHPIHPHMMTLALSPGIDHYMDEKKRCSACRRSYLVGFFYECGKEECNFQLHVQCATISEPLDHESHKHPLFLTSKPGERNLCRVCLKTSWFTETFNCIECDDFALCFSCATLPSKVRYKHDKHILTLCYGEESSTITYWCEACEKKIDRKERYYMCDEYCCVTLHVGCLIGKDLYMKSGSSFLFATIKVDVLSNNHHMSRPICYQCKKRCPQNIVFQRYGLKLCSLTCVFASY